MLLVDSPLNGTFFFEFDDDSGEWKSQNFLLESILAREFMQIANGLSQISFVYQEKSGTTDLQLNVACQLQNLLGTQVPQTWCLCQAIIKCFPTPEADPERGHCFRFSVAGSPSLGALT